MSKTQTDLSELLERDRLQEHIGAPGFPVDAAKLPERPLFRLTKEMVLIATKNACSPDSAYINDEVQKLHRSHIKSGGSGFAPRTDLVLARLNALAADGLLTKSRLTNGYYGYRWEFTTAGLAALQALGEKP